MWDDLKYEHEPMFHHVFVVASVWYTIYSVLEELD